ncbi:hypothetical protein LOC68_19845 [Blastopirellula sp. JC732]|uniref:Uncharacterized protein n=1 Tax=Blastopirellula sediminis TaxID=2894196 RepID=A0A9X1MQ00_9BACT|nr:hypothetical protein [Blastopirellula sediminis]MCC9630654.1 hypothetical protein [Blastopirellula sediminis]
MVIAIAAASLPLLMIREDQPDGAVYFGMSSVTLFLAALWMKARQLPFLNLALVPLVAIAYLVAFGASFRPLYGIEIDSIYVVVLLGLVYYAALFLISRLSAVRQAVNRTAWVLYSGVPAYAFFIAATSRLVEVDPAMPSPHALIACNLLRVWFGLLTVANLYWAGTDRGEMLDERPDLGVQYEATMVGLPYVALFLFLRMMRNAW